MIQASVIGADWSETIITCGPKQQQCTHTVNCSFESPADNLELKSQISHFFTYVVIANEYKIMFIKSEYVLTDGSLFLH